MGCNCKNGVSIDNFSNENKESNLPIAKRISFYFVRLVIFFIYLLISPVLMVYLTWLAFKGIVLSESLDVTALIKMLPNMLSKVEDDYIYEEDYNSLTEDDVYLINAEDITNKY